MQEQVSPWGGGGGCVVVGNSGGDGHDCSKYGRGDVSEGDC